MRRVTQEKRRSARRMRPEDVRKKISLQEQSGSEREEHLGKRRIIRGKKRAWEKSRRNLRIMPKKIRREPLN